MVNHDAVTEEARGDARPGNASPRTFGERWTGSDVVAFARAGGDVSLGAESESRIDAAHRALLAASRTRAVYGLSTGVGAKRFVPVERDLASCRRLWLTHAVQVGAPIDPVRVRAALVVRAVQIACGGSGVSLGLARGLASAAARGPLPELRDGATLGTGDIAPLSAIALALVAHGVAYEPSDGLPFISSNAVTLADAAVTLHDARLAAHAGTVVAGVAARAVRASTDHFVDEALGDQQTAVRAVAAELRGLRGSEPAVRVQEPFSIRLAPHSFGAVRAALDAADTVVERGVNGAHENPVVLPSGEVAHVGNFYAVDLALAVDGVVRALAHEASLAAARLGLLLDSRYTGLPDFLTDGTPDATGAMGLEYAAASALADVRECAAAGAASGVNVSLGAEEHAPFSAHAVRRLDRAQRAYRLIVACIATAVSRIPGAVDGVAGLVDASGDLADRDLSADVRAAVDRLDEIAG